MTENQEQPTITSDLVQQHINEKWKAEAAFNEAMAKAQADIEKLAFDAEVKTPKYRAKFATLAAVCNEARRVLSAHGLSVSQVPSSEIGPKGELFVRLTNVIRHSAGHTVNFPPFDWPVGGKGPHEMGSTITYMRRYSLAAILGVAGEEDDDGNIAMGQESSTSASSDRKSAKSSSGADRFQNAVTQNGLATAYEEFKGDVDGANTMAELMGVQAKWKGKDLPEGARAYFEVRQHSVQAQEAVA